MGSVAQGQAEGGGEREAAPQLRNKARSQIAANKKRQHPHEAE